MMGCSIRVCTCYCPASVSPWSMVGLHVCVFVVVSMRTLSSSSACAGEGCWECLVCTAVAGPGVAQAASSARTSPMLDLWWLLSSRTLGKKRYMFAACFPRNVVKYAAHTPNMVRGRTTCHKWLCCTRIRSFFYTVLGGEMDQSDVDELFHRLHHHHVLVSSCGYESSRPG